MTALVATRSQAGAPPGLAPLRDALLREAREEAARVVADAQAQGAAELAAVEGWVRAQLEAAHEQGRAEGAELVESEVAATRRELRSRMLRARHDVYEELVGRAEVTVRQLLADPARRRALDVRLRAALGQDAVVTDAVDGGLMARDGSGATIDASVRTLAADALAELDLEDLWAPR